MNLAENMDLVELKIERDNNTAFVKLTDLYRLLIQLEQPYPGCPVRHGGPLVAILLYLSCSDCPIMAVLFWLPCLVTLSGCPILAVLFCLSCSLYPVQAGLFYLSFFGLSDSSCPDRVVLFWLSFSVVLF
jgi:hypothetical protein